MVLLGCSGWWFCQCDSQSGWVPASYLEPLDGPEEAEEAEPDYAGTMLTPFRFTRWMLGLRRVSL